MGRTKQTARVWGCRAGTISAKKFDDFIYMAELLRVCIHLSIYLNDNQELWLHSKCLKGEMLSL